MTGFDLYAEIETWCTRNVACVHSFEYTGANYNKEEVTQVKLKSSIRGTHITLRLLMFEAYKGHWMISCKWYGPYKAAAEVHEFEVHELWQRLESYAVLAAL